MPIKSQYMDTVTGLEHQSKLWKLACLVSLSSTIVLALTCIVLGSALVFKLDRVRFILVPSIKGWTEAYPDQVTDEYIAGLFEHVATKLSNWNYWNFESNQEDLYKRFFAPELVVRNRENLRLKNFYSKIKENKLTSMFQVNQEESVYQWCEAIQAPCGITVGREFIYSDSFPYKEETIAYFMLGDHKLPEKAKPFAVRITRIIRTTPERAQALLRAAQKGQLPKQTEDI